MKRLITFALSLVMIFIFSTPARALYMPPSWATPTKQDIEIATNFFAGLKFDVSKAVTEKKITVTLPKMPSNYTATILQWSMNLDNSVADGVMFYQGSGGVTITKPIHHELKTGYHFSLFNDDTSAILALEFYTYIPGDNVVRYVPVENRIYPVKDHNGNIVDYVNEVGERVNEDGSPIGNSTIPTFKSYFPDVKKGYWALNVINKLYEAGYIKGYPNGTFRPDGNITRAEFMVILGKTLKDKWPDGKAYTHIVDPEYLSSGHWSFNIVNESFQYLHKQDIEQIFSVNFNPDRLITREEVVAALAAVLSVHHNFQAVPAAELVLSDTDESAFPDSIKFSVRYNLVNGYPDLTFRPKDDITRAEIAAVMVRMLEKMQ